MIPFRLSKQNATKQDRRNCSDLLSLNKQTINPITTQSTFRHSLNHSRHSWIYTFLSFPQNHAAAANSALCVCVCVVNKLADQIKFSYNRANKWKANQFQATSRGCCSWSSTETWLKLNSEATATAQGGERQPNRWSDATLMQKSSDGKVHLFFLKDSLPEHLNRKFYYFVCDKKLLR